MVTGSGGHAKQALLLHGKLKDHFDMVFVLEKTDPLTSQTLDSMEVPYFCMTSLRGKSDSWLQTIPKVIRGIASAYQTLRKTNPDIIISPGPGLAIPICWWAKIMGIKIIFIESWSRVTTRSFSGRAIYPIADLFFVQWEGLCQKYPKAKYAGRMDAWLGATEE